MAFEGSNVSRNPARTMLANSASEISRTDLPWIETPRLVGAAF
jgi:hypothetical protein